MKKYYYATGQSQFGPFSLEELRIQPITLDTLVWYDGLDSWRPVRDLPELASLFQRTPPASAPTMVYPQANTPPKPPTYSGQSANTGDGRGPLDYPQRAAAPPKTWLVESILVTLFCCLPFGIAGIVNASSVESRWHAGDFEGSQRASDEAKKWTMVSFFVGLGVFVLYVVLMFLGVALNI